MLCQKLSKIWERHPVEQFEICRLAAYVGDLHLITDQKLSPGTVTLLRNILKPDSVGNAGKTNTITKQEILTNYILLVYLNSNAEVWSYCISFHTKLSLKDEMLIDENVAILETALKTTNEQVRYHALRSLEDICAL